MPGGHGGMGEICTEGIQQSAISNQQKLKPQRKLGLFVGKAPLFAGGHPAGEVRKSSDQSLGGTNAKGVCRVSTGSNHYLLERALRVNIGVQRSTALECG